MALSDFYFARPLINGFGKMYFLKVFREADSYGSKLLGSVVKETWDYWEIAWWFPEPYSLAKPGFILDAIDKRRTKLKIKPSEKIVIASKLAGVEQNITIKKDVSFNTAVSSLPGIPGSMDLAVDYKRMKQMNFVLGAGARIEYIPTDYLVRLYRDCKGRASRIDPAVKVGISNNLMVNKVLIAKNCKYDFVSSKKFGVNFKAKIKAFQAQLESKVKFSFESDFKLRAHIQDGKEYLLAFGAIDWDHLK